MEGKPMTEHQQEELLAEAIEAHRKARRAFAVMQAAATMRDAAVAAAHEEGYSASFLASELGVNRQRIYQMIKGGEESAGETTEVGPDVLVQAWRGFEWETVESYEGFLPPKFDPSEDVEEGAIRRF